MVDSNEGPNYHSALYFVGRYKSQFLIVLLLIVMSAVVDSVSIVAFFPVFSALLGGASEEPSLILRLIVALADSIPVTNPVIASAVLLTSIFLVRTFVTLMREIVAARIVAKIHYEIKRDVIERYEQSHYQYMLDNPQGTLLFGSLDAPSSVSAVILTVARMTTALIKCCAIMVVLFSILPLATAVLSITGLVYYLGIHYVSKKISYGIGERKVAASMGQTIAVNEFLNGFRQIIALNTSKWWLNRFDLQSQIIRALEVKETIWYALPRPIMELVAVTVTLSMIILIWFTFSGDISTVLPIVGVFGVALVQLMPPMTEIGAQRMRLMVSLPSLNVVHNIIQGPIPMRRKGYHVLGSFQDAIRFENVTFAYPGRPALFDKLNLSIGKGTTTAIVGPSGGGKSTIVNLLLGLFEPTSGTITVDGVPMDDLDRLDWIDRIGLVSQDSFMYHDTALENIKLGRQDVAQESILKATRLAYAHDFIQGLPEGYDTVVGERGMKISGGQQQRLAIARAILDSPEILIFDEATSSLDGISEKYVQDSMDAVSVDHTVVIISHRISTIQNAHNIIVLDDGKIVESGSHSELLSLDGKYTQLINGTHS